MILEVFCNLNNSDSKHNALTHTLSMSGFCCSMQCTWLFFVLPLTNQFKHYLKSQTRFLSFLPQTETAREISSLTLKQGWSLLALLFLASSVNHYVISATDPDPANTCLQQSSLHRALSTDVRETKVSASLGVSFLPVPPWNSFHPVQGVLSWA